MYERNVPNAFQNFFFFVKNQKNRLKRIRLISFAHVWLYFTGIKIVCSFLKLNCYNLDMFYTSPKGGDWHNIFFLIIYPFIYFILILVPLYRRKFCDGHIILVFFFYFYIHIFSCVLLSIGMADDSYPPMLI